jgi:type II secretory pathway pseudopilin PulG
MKKFTIIASLVLMMVVGTSSAQAVTSRPRSQAPARAEATNSNMKILTLAEAQAITFTWTDAQGVEHANSIADPATDPRHIVALLREIYINRKVPGIKKVGYSSADVTTPDSGPVTYIITDDYLDNQNWSTWERRYLATERNNENHKVRTIYNIPVTQQAYRYDNPTGYYFDDYMPEDEGYTTLLVKTKHDIINIGSPSTYDELIDGISKNIEEVVLLTQGKYYAKGDGIGKSGALYKTSGTASSFYFISKGKARRNTGTGRTWSFAPFFGLYEEYSPEIVNSSTQTTDVWVKMKNGNDYKVQHDCGSVIILNHQFNMADREESHSIDNMVFFIPDRRLENWDNRDPADLNSTFTNYKPAYAPAIAMLYIPLKATGAKNASDGKKWDITLTWSSNLNAMTGNVIPQKFNLYIVDDAGNRTLLKQDFTDAPDAQGNYHYTYTVDRETEARHIRYVVEGTPLEGEFSPVTSNRDLVEVPGLDPNQRLQLGLNVSPESNYNLAEELNVYRNHLNVSNSADVYITRDYLTKPNARMELYRHWTDAEGNPQEVRIATIGTFTPDGDKGYTYKVEHYNQDHPMTADVFDPSDNSTHFVVATGSTDGKIDFGKLEIWDQFSASTSQNLHPSRYTYDVRYLWDGIKTDAGVDYFYSSAVPVDVYKTTTGNNNQTFTAEQVEADHTLNAIDRRQLQACRDPEPDEQPGHQLLQGVSCGPRQQHLSQHRGARAGRGGLCQRGRKRPLRRVPEWQLPQHGEHGRRRQDCRRDRHASERREHLCPPHGARDMDQPLQPRRHARRHGTEYLWRPHRDGAPCGRDGEACRRQQRRDEQLRLQPQRRHGPLLQGAAELAGAGALNAAPGEIPHLALYARRRGHGGNRCGSLQEAS